MHFFFYGTLIAGSGNQVADAAHVKLRSLGPAVTEGRVYAVGTARGWYPALLPGRSRVHGMLYEASARFGSSDLARLDAYEDFSPADPANSLYLRREISVTRPDGIVTRAQAYRFNRPLPAGARRIEDGDFRAWLEQSRLRAFGD